MAKTIRKIRAGKEILVSRSVILWQKRRKKRLAEEEKQAEEKQQAEADARRRTYRPIFE